MAKDDCIAIIGLACRFPGDASSPERFWDLLASQRDSYSMPPPNRWNSDAFHHPGKDKLHTMANPGAHFLAEDVMAFDAGFFNINHAEATALDPQQRLTLEVTYEAFESAGLTVEAVAGTKTGCFMGSSGADYRDTINRDPDSNPRYSLLGVVTEMISNRTSWFYDLKGPSMTIQTACSSSLVAVHLACQSIRNGDSEMAIAGGVTLMLNPDFSVYLNNMTMSSKGGHCRAFDAAADGYSRGEGCGVIVLKRLSDALRDGDPIRGLVRGSGVNADGFTQGITMPSAAAQATLIRDIYKSGGLNMSDTQYVEAHGTGTKVGDPVEARALYETLGKCASASPSRKLVVGSVKPNIGHLECAAGVAALIKGVLMLEKGMIPPNIYFETPNPEIPFDQWNLKVPTSMTPWPASATRRISINSFGVGGTNAHVVLEAAPETNSSHARHVVTTSKGLGGLGALLGRTGALNAGVTPSRKRLYAISSHDNGGIARVCQSLVAHLGKIESRDSLSPTYLADLAFTLGSKRSRLHWKAYCLATDLNNLREQLSSLQSQGTVAVRCNRNRIPSVGFVFTGQAAQWARMGVELLENTVYRRTVEDCDRHLADIGCRWSALIELQKPEGSSKIDEPEFSQTLCTVVQIALVDLLDSWAVRPSRVVGHSSGEIAAAYCIGALSKRDAVSVAYLRGVASASLRKVASGHQGGMMAVACSQEDVEHLIDGMSGADLTVACINSPINVTVSGSVKFLEKLQTTLEEMGVFARRLAVDVAYHSDHMQAIYPPYVQSMDHIKPRSRDEIKSNTVMYSSVDLGEVSAESLNSFYWGRNLINTVLFSDALTDMILKPAEHEQPTTSPAPTSQIDILVEIGSHSALGAPIEEVLEKAGVKGVEYKSALSRGQNAVDTTLGLAGWLFSRGVTVDIGKVNADKAPEALVDLPAYPWNHSRRFDATPRLNREFTMRTHPQKSLLGAPFTTIGERERIWRSHLRLSEEGWIRDHKILSVTLFPGAGLIVMAIEAARQMTDPGKNVRAFKLRDVSIGSAVVVNEDKTTEAIIHLRPHLSGTAGPSSSSTWLEFTISTSGGSDMPLRENCHGLIQIDYIPINDEHMQRETLKTIESRVARYEEAAKSCSYDLKIDDFYQDFANVGLAFGPTFRNITGLRLGQGQSVFELTIGDPGETFSTGQQGRHHLIHPTTLDSIFSPTFSALYNGTKAFTKPLLPTFIEELIISEDIPDAVGHKLRGFVEAGRRGLGDFSADIEVFDQTVSSSFMTMRGFRCTSEVSSDNQGQGQYDEMASRLCSEPRWEPSIDLSEPAVMQRALDNHSSDANKRVSKILKMLYHAKHDIKVLEFLPDAENVELAMQSSILAMSTGPQLYPARFAKTDQSSSQDSENVLHLDLDSLPRTYTNADEQFDVIVIPGRCRNIGHRRNHVLHIRSLLKPMGKIISFVGLGLPQDAIDGLSIAYDFRGPNETVTIYNNSQDESTHAFAKTKEIIIIIEPPARNAAVAAFSKSLATELRLQGIESRTIRWGHRLKELGAKDRCINLLELEQSYTDNLSAADFELMQDVILKTAGVVWVTGSYGPQSAVSHGLLRSVRRESPGQCLRSLQLCPKIAYSQQGARIAARLALSSTEETEFLVEQDGLVQTSRIFLDNTLNDSIKSIVSDQIPLRALRDVDFPIKLTAGKPGILDTLHFEQHTGMAAPLEDDEVEIRVSASGINFRDVMISMGIIPAPELGYEASGVVVALGPNVTAVKKGDRVCAHAVGSHANLVRTRDYMCAPIPDNVTFEEGAAMPVVLTTAYHALVNLARLRPGQSVLIHAAAGGVGQAAIQLAQHLGATVYATVSNQEKCELVMNQYGVPAEHIFYSRDTSFGMAVRRVTGGRGVDCVLNSLAGELLRESFYCLAPLGIMVEIGSRDIIDNTRLDMRPFSRSTTFTCFNLLEIIKEAPEIMAQATRGAFELVQQGALKPPYPIQVLPASQIQDALRLMQTSKHIGKLVLSFQEDSQVPVKRGSESLNLKLKPNYTYLLVGGLGGLGRSLARHFVSSGARNLAFISRSGATSEASRALIDDLSQRGALVKAYRADIADNTALRSALSSCSTDMPPIIGVLQMAMLLRDSPFETTTHDQWVESTRPKIQGSWNLHRYFDHEHTLDFFINFSSISGIIGSKGQSNYAAGCTFQDALAQQRRSDGLKGISVDLGIMLDVGVLAESGTQGDLKRWEEVLGVREHLFHALMKTVIEGQQQVDKRTTTTHFPTQVCVGLGTAAAFSASRVSRPDYLSNDLRFGPLNGLESSVAGEKDEPGAVTGVLGVDLKTRLSGATNKSQAAEIVTGALVAKVADLLQIASLEVDTSRPIYLYGVDSLVAMEMRNWVRREMGAQMAIFDILEAVPITQLAQKIADRSQLIDLKLLDQKYI